MPCVCAQTENLQLVGEAEMWQRQMESTYASLQVGIVGLQVSHWHDRLPGSRLMPLQILQFPMDITTVDYTFAACRPRCRTRWRHARPNVLR